MRDMNDTVTLAPGGDPKKLNWIDRQINRPFPMGSIRHHIWYARFFGIRQWWRATSEAKS